ncbi:hypothetical protein AOPFMNJM_2198 [Methylobacterium jeotgali]|uniref:Uncharacterized protein n=1 Tax=Methylobacterium jeotgali TaxID=381630 RepID=A0ABQ4SY61_9HYPH|nr:hypothetical protein AOPFMNJM_2198 [Methylobacterium jeotgali]
MQPALPVGGALEEPQRRGAHRHDPPAPRAGLVEGLGGLLREDAVLGVHPVGVGVLGLHRQEGARPDMQGEAVARDARRVERGDQRLREVQAGGGGGHRSGLVRVDGLVVDRVPRVRRAPAGDIGGQRQDADRRDRRVEGGPGEVEAQGDLAALPLLRHRRREVVRGALGRRAEAQHVARRDALARPGEGAPQVRRLPPVQHRFDAHALPAWPRAQAREAGRDHAGVVEDEGVAGAQQARQIAHAAVLQGFARPHHEEPARVARARGAQRDARLRQLEIEQVHPHQTVSPTMARRCRSSSSL